MMSRKDLTSFYKGYCFLSDSEPKLASLDFKLTLNVDGEKNESKMLLRLRIKSSIKNLMGYSFIAAMMSLSSFFFCEISLR